MAASLGFLSVRQHPEHGYFGGYLLTNLAARPLEFHCTMPVKPSRAQELLYGPTLDDFVCGEQIAKALVNKAKLKPDLVLTNCRAVLAIAQVSNVLTAQLQFEADDSFPHFRTPQGNQSGLQSLVVDPWQLQLPASVQGAEEKVRSLLSQLAANFDLTEPFQRVSDALLEAHPIAKAA
ncbi:MAG: hypothetical protein KDA45_11385 [Planctomycetales bacterium]|nr:hypothetical protein [Planctomycetales bacterium]